jgi:hypothetical protein
MAQRPPFPVLVQFQGKERVMLKKLIRVRKNVEMLGCLGVALLATSMVLVMPLSANAASEEIWGRQTGLGKFLTEKVNIPRMATIVDTHYEGAGDGFCIWSGVPYPALVVCWRSGGASLVGTTLPPDQGYFVIPDKRTVNSPAYATVRVEF